MRKLEVEVLFSPESEWIWRVFDAETEKTLRRGSSTTRDEALAAAEEAKRKIESQTGID
jgi:hypothetical protein